jgi:hypothetical protein
MSNGRLFFGKIILCLLVFTTIEATLHAQDSKAKVRLSVGFAAQEPGRSSLNITAKYRGEEGIEPARALEFQIYYMPQPDSLVPVGTAMSDADGMAVYELRGLESAMADSSGGYH